MNKNIIIRDYIVNELNEDIKKGYQVNDSWLMKKISYYSVNKATFDKKVSYEINYDEDYKCNYYTNFQYK